MNNLNVYFEKIYTQICENKSSDIYFWGASLFLKEFLSKYNLDEIKNIKGIIDIDINKSGHKLDKYTIITPKEIKNTENIKIIFTIKNNAKCIYDLIKQEISLKNISFELLPNIFENINDDSTIDKISSNKLYLINSKGEKKEVSYIPNLQITWVGSNSTVELEGIPRFRNCKFVLHDSCSIKIGKTPYLIDNFIVMQNAPNQKLNIEKNFSCRGLDIKYGGEPNGEINIGDDCMFSNNIQIRPTDAHTIFSINEKKIINYHHKPTKIGNHVWVGTSVILLKNTNISNNSVVGAGSVVTKEFKKENVVIAGNPAKIIKENINWDRKNTSDFIRGECDDAYRQFF